MCLKADSLASRKYVQKKLQATLWKTQHRRLFYLLKKVPHDLDRGVPTLKPIPIFCVLFQPPREGGWVLGLLVLPKAAQPPSLGG